MAKYGHYSSDGKILQEYEGDSMTQDKQHGVKIWKGRIFVATIHLDKGQSVKLIEGK